MYEIPSLVMYEITERDKKKHKTRNEPLSYLPAALLPLSMVTSAMDPNRGAAAPCAPNGGARRLGLGSLALPSMPLFGAPKWRPSKK